MIKIKVFAFGLFFLFVVIGCEKSPVDSCQNCPVQKTDTTSHEFIWSIDTIGIFQSYLNDVWGTNQNNVYAVGFIRWKDKPLPSNIAHWDGTHWQSVDYLETTELKAVYGFGENDLWVAGIYYLNDRPFALASHWNGVLWQHWKMDQYDYLTSLWGTSSSNLFAVGGNGTILHFDGSAWNKMQTNTTHRLTGIWGTSDGQIYAVGGTESIGMGILLKYTESGWIKLLERTYQPNLLSGVLSTIWGESGQRFFANEYVGRDTVWQKFNWPNDNTFLEKARGDHENNVFAVGSFSLIIHYNGSTMKRYDQFYKKPVGDLLQGIWTSGKNVFILGLSPSGQSIVYHGIQ